MNSSYKERGIVLGKRRPKVLRGAREQFLNGTGQLSVRVGNKCLGKQQIISYEEQQHE